MTEGQPRPLAAKTANGSASQIAGGSPQVVGAWGDDNASRLAHYVMPDPAPAWENQEVDACPLDPAWPAWVRAQLTEQGASPAPDARFLWPHGIARAPWRHREDRARLEARGLQLAADAWEQIAHPEAVALGADDTLPLVQDVAICIDAARTRDADDAFCLQARPDGGWDVCVHVVHPVEAMPLDSPMERMALLRGASLYSPCGDVHMLPPAWSCGRLSLLATTVRPVLRVCAKFRADGTMEAWTLDLVRIRVHRNASYDEVDAVLARAGVGAAETDPDAARFVAADAWADARRRQREAAGAINTEGPRVRASFEGASLTLDARDRTTASHRLVGELMILFNEIVGHFCARHGLPVKYRVLSQPPDSIQVTRWNAVRDRRIAAYHLGGLLRGGSASETHGPQLGVGVEAYVQASSPLRRYTDLLVHHAIRQVLRPNFAGLLSRPDVLDRWSRAEANARTVNQAMGRMQRYWVMQWVTQHDATTCPGVVIDVDPGPRRATIWTEPSGLMVRVTGAKGVQIGQQVQVALTRLDLEGLRIDARLI